MIFGSQNIQCLRELVELEVHGNVDVVSIRRVFDAERVHLTCTLDPSSPQGLALSRLEVFQELGKLCARDLEVDDLVLAAKDGSSLFVFTGGDLQLEHLRFFHAQLQMLACLNLKFVPVDLMLKHQLVQTPGGRSLVLVALFLRGTLGVLRTGVALFFVIL